MNKETQDAASWRKLKDMIEAGEAAVVPCEAKGGMLPSIHESTAAGGHGKRYKAAIRAAPDIIKQIEGE